MKQFLFLILFQGYIIAQAQDNLCLNYNSIGSGRSVNLLYSKILNPKNEVGVGLVYNINKLVHDDDQNNIFHKRLYATKNLEHFGVEAFYHRRLTDRWEKTFEPYIFYDVQVKYAPTRNRSFTPYAYSEEIKDYLYVENINYWGPFTWMEQNIGLGYKAKIKGNWYISQKIGVGTDFILSKDIFFKDLYEEAYLYGQKFSLEFEMLIQTGFVYKFNKKEP